MNVLVTGANGFLGSNIVKISNNSFNFFGVTKSNFNLFSVSDIDAFLFKNKIDAIIHCAIEGGRRLEKDDYDVFYKNILMYENLMKFKDRYKIFINIASGAEFDRQNNINVYKEEELYKNVPVDYYGLSKNIISKLHNQFQRGINLRLFNCFYPNELDTRFISNNIRKYINKQSMVIHQDRYLDFFYLKDFIKILEYYLYIPMDLPNDINVSYKEKYKLSDILNKINNLNEHKSEIIIKEDGLTLSYTGDSNKLEKLNISFKGIDNGINYCYNYFLK